MITNHLYCWNIALIMQTSPNWGSRRFVSHWLESGHGGLLHLTAMSMVVFFFPLYLDTLLKKKKKRKTERREEKKQERKQASRDFLFTKIFLRQMRIVHLKNSMQLKRKWIKEVQHKQCWMYSAHASPQVPETVINYKRRSNTLWTQCVGIWMISL